VRRALGRRARRLRRPPWLGVLRRTTPLSEAWGADRGTPVDRYYIERFLEVHGADIRGRMLEVRDSRYTSRFGTGVTAAEVLDVDEGNPEATIVADLSAADSVEAESFDGFLLTQTLQYIRDPAAALRHARRILKPGGVLLATVPGISRIDTRHADRDLWRFTPRACSALFAETWSGDEVEVTAVGNVLAAAAFLYGVAAEELAERDLARHDPNYPVVVCVRAVRQRSQPGPSPGVVSQTVASRSSGGGDG
jgi:SAM-dependent methyltransferase